MLEVARLLTVYDADTRPFDQKSRGVESTLGKLGSGDVFGGMVASQLFMEMGRALASLAQEGVQTYADFERLGSTMQSLTARELISSGEARNMGTALAMSAVPAKELLNWVQQLAIHSPFTTEGVALAFRQSMAYGFTTDEAKRLTQAMIDFAAGSGTSEAAMSQIALALGQIKAKGKLAGQEILQLVNAGIPVQSVLAQAFGKSTAEIVNMTEAGLVPADAAIQAIVKSLEKDFGGAAERQTNTVAGLISTLSDVKDMGFREFFTGFFAETQPLLTEFVSTLQNPATMNSLREIGQSVGETARTIAEAGKTIIDVWNSVPEPIRNTILAMAAFEASTPALADASIAGLKFVGTLKSMPAFLKETRVAMELLKEGESVFDVMSLGSAGMAATLIPLTLAVGSVVAVWATWNEQIAKTQKSGMEENAAAWTKTLGDVAAKGGGSAQVVKAYADGIVQVNAAYEAGGIVAGLFVNKQKILGQGLKTTVGELANTSKSWGEYKRSVEMAAAMAGYQIDAQGRFFRVFRDGRGVQTEYIDGVTLMTGAQQVFNSTLETDAVDRWAQRLNAANQSQTNLLAVTLGAKDILSIYGEALKAVDIPAEQSKQLQDALGVALGQTSSAQADLTSNANLYAQATALGIVSQAEFTTAMLAAKDGTLTLSDAERQALQDKVNLAQAEREAGKAARDHAAEMWGLAESLKGAGAAELAKTMIQDLTTAIRDGTGDPEQLGKAIETLGKTTGLMDDRSIALAANLPKLTDAIKNGIIPSKDAANAMRDLSADAADGTVNWDKFLGRWAKAPEQLKPGTDAVSAVSDAAGKLANKDVPGVTAALDTEMPKWQKEASDTSLAIQKSFASVNWAGVGTSITDGISLGIRNGTGQIEKAAGAAARAAYVAAMNALDAHSPSRKMMYVGEMAVAGFAQPFQDAGQQIRSNASDMAMASVAGASNAGGGSSTGQAGSAVTLVVQYSPWLSTASDYEARRILSPILIDELRKLGIAVNG